MKKLATLYRSVATVSQLDAFDEVIDVRSPAEFADDHVPGAINCPVLDDAQRAHVGTLYKQASPFEAKRVGAAMVARNIADHLEFRLADRPRSWRAVIYCWRGGGRSEAMCEVLHRVGWDVARLDGGYRAYRREVVQTLDALPDDFPVVTVCGRTGTGKSRLLLALHATGAQVLDLEVMARHRGSLLGDLPAVPQPSQKLFESRLHAALRRFAADRPVYVESESRKIGNLQVPARLLARMRAAPCVRLEAELPVRIALLREEYAHFLADADALAARLGGLIPLHGRERVEDWVALARAGRHDELVEDLLVRHYDPAYDRSTSRNYVNLGRARVHVVERTGEQDMLALARTVAAG